MPEKWRVVFRPEARDELRAIAKTDALRILAKLTQLESDPLGFTTTALVGRPEYRRLRVGHYRVIYSMEHDHLIIWVIKVAGRSEVYD